jgi:hypothetical protein
VHCSEVVFRLWASLRGLQESARRFGMSGAAILDKVLGRGLSSDSLLSNTASLCETADNTGSSSAQREGQLAP